MFRFLPILLILSTFYFLLPTPILAAAAQPESLGGIDEEDPSWSEEIIIRRNARENADGTLTLPQESIIVGPQVNQLKFPKLEELDQGVTNALPYLLPENLRQQFEASPPQQIPLKGKIYHPVCQVRAGGEEREAQGIPSTGASEVTTPPWWTHILGVTKLAQAIGVPGVSSAVNFGPAQVQELDDHRHNQAGDCEVAQGPEDGVVEQAQSAGGTTINLGNLFQAIIGFISELLDPGESVPVEIVIKAKKFIPGESDFAEQTSDKLGFLRSFCPEGLCPEVSGINEQETTPYRDEDDKSKRLEYQGVSGARDGLNTLAQSLYPAELQSLIVPRSGGAPYTYPPGTGDVLDFTIPYMDAKFMISDELKQRIITQVLTNWPNSKIQDLWNTVVSESKASGVNPAFTLAIWIEESGAGGVPAQSEFGCFPGGDTSQIVSFDQSLRCFFYFTSVEHPNNFTEWIRYFCGPKAEPICSNNQGFITRLKFWWEKFVK